MDEKRKPNVSMQEFEEGGGQDAVSASRVTKTVQAEFQRKRDVVESGRIRKFVKPTPLMARTLMGMTREQAAKELGTTVYILTGIETGRGDVSLKVARGMERLYGWTMDELFPET